MSFFWFASRIVVAALGLSVSAGIAAAQDFPSRTIHVVIGFPAGSGADILGRFFTNKLQEASGQPVIVDNKPGANSNIAIGLVKNAKPDGYTMLFVANSNMAFNKFLFKSLPFDTIKDFAPVHALAQLGFVVTLSPNSPNKTMADLTTFLKSRPQNKYGTTNQTAILSSESYRQAGGFEAINVGYRTAPDALPDVENGTLDFMIMDGTFAAAPVRNGKIKALAVTSKWRIATMPDVPTMQEAGFKDFEFAPWWASFVPAGTPQPVIDKLAGYFARITATDDAKVAMEKIAAFPLVNDGKWIADKLLADQRWIEPIIKAAKIEPQD